MSIDTKGGNRTFAADALTSERSCESFRSTLSRIADLLADPNE
jgi:hypothetical protein